MRAQEADLEPALAAAARQIERFHQAYRRLGQVPDGAAQAADLIMSFATSGRGAAA